LLLWYGLAIVVRCDRMQDGRVDVMVDRRFYGFLTVNSTSVKDVINADVYYVWDRTSGGGRKARGYTESIELTPRTGAVVRRNKFGPSFGNLPDPMSTRINHFINESSEPSDTIWWMPWLVNVAAIPFVLILGGVIGSILLHKLGFFKTPPDTTKEDLL
jgi:hypothetical protein